ncbi:hypothetical protein K438DRAFT_1947662 [Mycena galopus ATCC 62051]|nr:hypothetical protein K438DRAFT_1947662 [Mycena galopus ATCC 62051]
MAQTSAVDASRTHSPSVPDSTHIKIEAPPPVLPLSVKAEPETISLRQPPQSGDVKMRVLTEDGHEVLELLSDSDEDEDLNSDQEVIEALRRTSRSSSILAPSTPDSTAYDDIDSVFGGEPSYDDQNSAQLTEDDSSAVDSFPLVESNTVWEDGSKSFVRDTGIFHPIRGVTVERMEYRDGPAFVYPMHRTRTGLVVDMSHQKYNFCHPTTKDLYTVNVVIQNSDNDGWETNGGGGKASVVFAPGEAPLDCKSFRFMCKGATACDKLDPALRSHIRFELDPVSRDAVIAAQQETRRREGNTNEERATMFMTIIQRAKCIAIDSKGVKCKGGPVLRSKPQGMSNGHQYFVACSGWTKQFKDNHRTHTIPDHVDEHLLIKALAGQPLTDDKTKDTPPCSAIIHPHIGLKKKKCAHPHIVNGVAVKGEITAHKCPARRTIYVPEDSSIRKALIIHNITGHNHPMPTIIKVSFTHKDTYRQCIDAHGVLGATVAKVDNASSTQMLLNGKKPSEYAPALYNKRIKKDLLHTKKIEQYPNGLGVEAILPMFHADLAKPHNERYIHNYTTTPKGEIIIIMFIPALLHLLDDPGVTSFDGDTTFKGIEGKVNEWELTIFAKVVQRAASILRAFVTGASADFFEFLFDEIQRIKLSFTRKPLPFKTFIRGGNLHVTNVDMDGAQVIGLTRSVLKYSDPEYSGIPLDTPPEKVAPKFIKVCWRHAKEPIHDFRSLVSTSDFNRLKNCFYIEDKEALDAFSAFVYGLRIKKITDWWKHKEMHEWIIPCMVKSQSGISAETWDATPSTTNTNEGLHAWTNSLAGIELTPVEALESRRKIDSDVSREIKMSLSTGILANPNNEMSHRMARDSHRRSAATQKTRDSHAAADLVKDLRLQIEEAAAHTKALKAELKATKGSSGRGKSDSSAILSASSSGRVRTAPARTAARTNAPAIQSSIPTAASSSSPALDMSTLPLSPIPALDMMSTAPPIPIPTLEPSLIPIPVPEMLTAPSIPIPTLEPWMNEFDSFSFSPDFDLSFLGGVPNTMDAFLGFDMGPSLPFSGTPVTYPLDNYVNGFTASFDGQDATVNPSNFGSLAAFDPLPLLPPLPPPDSPPAMALTAASEAPKSRRHRQEVNEADILPENSKRTRAPSTRKRSAEEDVIPDQLPKKGKRNT